MNRREKIITPQVEDNIFMRCLDQKRAASSQPVTR